MKIKAFFQKILKILKISGKVAEDVGPEVLTAVNPAAGAIAEIGVQEIEQETAKPAIPKT